MAPAHLQFSWPVLVNELDCGWVTLFNPEKTAAAGGATTNPGGRALPSPFATSHCGPKFLIYMPEQFHVRLATPADADIIGWHRARMFRDMGDVPPHLFDKFCAMSRERLREQLTSGEYIGWLASPGDSLGQIIGGAGVQLRRVMPHPLTSQMAKLELPKAVTPSSSTSSPNRNGVDAVSPRS